jgi:hypothetical protein
MRLQRASLLAGLVVALVSLVAAGCGGGSDPPSVASLGGSHTTTTSGGDDSGGSTSSGGGGFGLAMKSQDGREFSQCMRSHGVPNFPDPNARGDLTIGPSSGINPGSAKFQAALRACQKVLPNGGQPTPQQLAKARQGALAFSACMRSHGVPDFPDPTFSSGGGGIGIGVHISAGGDLNPQSPTFQAAQQACQGHLPFKGAGLKTSAGGK